MSRFYFIVQSELGQTIVFYKRQRIGTLISTRERNGRHCFQLAADSGPRGRTYRGREVAAQALLAIHKLLVKAKRQNWQLDTLVANAWKCRPEMTDF